MANGGLLKELQELQPAPGVTTELPPRDVRSRRPFLLRAIIRLRTLRSIARVLVLGALDAAGIFLAIWTALELKALLRDKSDLALSFDQAKDVAPLASVSDVTLPMRQDKVTDGGIAEKVLANAPGGAVYIEPDDKNAGGFFTVPKVVE